MAKKKPTTKPDWKPILKEEYVENKWEIYLMYPGFDLWLNDKCIKQVDSFIDLFNIDWEQLEKEESETKFGELRDKIEKLHEWEYVESEGPEKVRFDFIHESGQPASMWIYITGQKDGNIPMHLDMDIKVLLQEYNKEETD